MTTNNIFNYSKWDHIELSDDESDLHPNIDKDSWFRLKHRTRLEREAKEDEEVKKLDVLNEEATSRLKVLYPKLNRLKNGITDDDGELEDIDGLVGEITELENQIATRKKYIDEVNEKRKWNIDNICTVKEEKTVIGKSSASSLKASDFKPTGLTESRVVEAETVKKSNKEDKGKDFVVLNPKAVTTTPPSVGPRSESPTRERFAVISYNDYVLTHEEILEKYSEISDLEATKDYLFKNCDILLHEHAQSYMLLSCLEDEMNNKKERAKLVCRQSQILSQIHELGVSLGRDPRDVILPFFKRIDEAVYKTAFSKAVQDFHSKIANRAVEKRKEMDAEERKSAAPGGLDPQEVFNQLPEELQAAFEAQSIEKLQEVLSAMSQEDAKKYMKMCVDSGLWVPKDSAESEE